jgi:PAS domain S-box-containing protein
VSTEAPTAFANTSRGLTAPAALDETGRFFDSSHDLLATTSQGGHFRPLNGAWKEVPGYSESEMVGRLFVEFIHPDDVEATLAVSAKIRAGDYHLKQPRRASPLHEGSHGHKR